MKKLAPLLFLVLLCGCITVSHKTTHSTSVTAPPPCPPGFVFVSFEPRRTFPDGTVKPEGPLHGPGGTLRIVFDHGVLYCKVAPAAAR